MADKILVADDSLTIQKVVAITLANEPWVLVEATDESELFGKLRGGDYRLVLFDFNLSESKSGYELSQEIKKLAPQVKTLAMLGTFDSVDDSNLVQAGVDAKIVKPFDSQKFIQKCRELIDSSAEAGLSSAEEESLAFSESDQNVADDSDGWTMDSPSIQENDFDPSLDSSDTWDEDTSPGISVDQVELQNDNALSDELEGWGVSIPEPIGATEPAHRQIPPIIDGNEKKTEILWQDDPAEVSEEEIEFQVSETAVEKKTDDEETVYPENNELDYPDLEIETTQPKSSMISLDQLVEDKEDDVLPLQLNSKPAPVREDLAKEIESELSADDFWAADEDSSSDLPVKEVELSQEYISTNDDSDDRESFVVGVGDPLAPVEPIRPSQKSSLTLDSGKQATSFNEEEIVEKIKASLVPILDEMVRRYMDEKIEKVAWEIIPDVAENLIRKEIKELSQATKNS